VIAIIASLQIPAIIVYEELYMLLPLVLQSSHYRDPAGILLAVEEMMKVTFPR
jgi:hypothetical protein